MSANQLEFEEIQLSKYADVQNEINLFSIISSNWKRISCGNSVVYGKNCDRYTGGFNSIYGFDMDGTILDYSSHILIRLSFPYYIIPVVLCDCWEQFS